MGCAEGFVLRRNAAAERTGGRRSRLLRGGIPRAGNGSPPQRARTRARRAGILLPSPSLRGGPIVSGGIERKVPWTPDGPEPGNRDAVQRPIRDAPNLLSRVEGGLLFRRGSQGDPGCASRAQEVGSPGVGGVRRLRVRAGEPDVLRGRPRAAVRRGLGLSERLHRAERNVLPAARVVGPGSPGARTILPRDPRGFFAEPSPVLPGSGANRDVLDRGTGHPDDHGLAQASSWIPPLLHLRRDVPRLSGRGCSAASGPFVRTVPRGDPGRSGVPLALSRLR